MSLRSALYVGSVFHRRLKPKPHRFRYALFWLLLDLDEIDAATTPLRWLKHNRRALFSFNDADHGDGSATPIRAQADALLRDEGVDLEGGRIALLFMPRTLGVVFNPLSIYFCFDASGALVALIHQVHNTFGGRHAYVLKTQGAKSVRQGCDKAFFVSPFMPMDLTYQFDVTVPAERITVAIRVNDREGPLLRAALTGERRELTDANLFRAGLRVPAIGLKTLVAIHFEAVRLWLKGVRFLGGPGQHQAAGSSVYSPTSIEPSAKPASQ